MLKRCLQEPILIQYDFRVATEGDMEKLGRAFAEVVSLENTNLERILTIGIVGEYDCGKTFFSKGLISKFSPVDIDILNHEPFNRSSRDGESICHYDHCKESYYVPPIDENEHGIVIVEHADESDLDFNYWVTISINRDGSRRVSIEIPEEEADEQGVLAFIEQSRTFSIS